jgi:6-phosphogluconolactonase (cycloisomerase 2 family)
VLKIDGLTGRLTLTRQTAAVPLPVCLLFGA